MPEQIENRMVVDSEWEHLDPKEVEVDTIVGYSSLDNSEFVEEGMAYEYALDVCLNGSDDDKKEFKEMLVEWFFSGNWIKEERYGRF